MPSKASKSRGLLSGRALLEFEVAEAKTSVRNDGYNDEAGPAEAAPRSNASVENNTAEATCNFIYISVAGEL